MVELNDYAVSVDALSDGAWARWREDGWIKIASHSSPAYREAMAEALARHHELIRPLLDPDAPHETELERAEKEYERVTKRLFAEHLIRDARNITVQGEPLGESSADRWFAIIDDPRHVPFWDWLMVQAASPDRFRETEVARMAKNCEAACSGNSDTEATTKPS